VAVATAHEPCGLGFYSAQWFLGVAPERLTCNDEDGWIIQKVRVITFDWEGIQGPLTPCADGGPTTGDVRDKTYWEAWRVRNKKAAPFMRDQPVIREGEDPNSYAGDTFAIAGIHPKQRGAIWHIGYAMAFCDSDVQANPPQKWKDPEPDARGLYSTHHEPQEFWPFVGYWTHALFYNMNGCGNGLPNSQFADSRIDQAHVGNNVQVQQHWHNN
jgi:hypothetical protein